MCRKVFNFRLHHGTWNILAIKKVQTFTFNSLPHNVIIYCRYFQSGGNPVQVIEQLSENYTAVAQMANLIAEWLIIGGTYLLVQKSSDG